MCFILGNLSSDDADTRDVLFSRHSALPTLNAVFDKYLALEREQVGTLWIYCRLQVFYDKNILFWKISLYLIFLAESATKIKYSKVMTLAVYGCIDNLIACVLIFTNNKITKNSRIMYGTWEFL